MIVDFSNIDLLDRPTLILKNSAEDPIGVLGYAKQVVPDIKFNETSTLDFEYPSSVDGVPTDYYNSLVGMRTIELQGVGQFVLLNPVETGDGVQKTKKCKGYSLDYEFVFKKITLTKGTYNFWNPLASDNTLLGIILELMPSWSVGNVDQSLIGKYRTFEVNGENLYNFIKGTVQVSYGCIFNFDTINRTINVIDASGAVSIQPVFLSQDNLVKELEIKENTENIVTRLEVNGAEGVTIRDVNPSGTNRIINLDYYMNTSNFQQGLIDKYYAWKQTYEENQSPYYNLTVEYSLETMRKVTEQTALTELNGEMASLENIQAVVIRSIARGLSTQEALDEANANIAAKQAEIDEKQSLISSIESNLADILSQMRAINSLCNFDTYFTDEEYIQLDKFIKDDEVAESSFAATDVDSYTTEDVGNNITSTTLSIIESDIVRLVSQSGKTIYDISSGEISIGELVSANVITAALEVDADNSFVFTSFLDAGSISDSSFIKACISLTGTLASISDDTVQDPDAPGIYNGTQLSAEISNAYLYFTLNTSEYQRRSVAWDLFKYGSEILNKLSKPSYTFTIDSANFLSLDEFITFKQNLSLGNKVYIEKNEDDILTPILIGARFSYDDLSTLDLEFGDSYSSGESSFELADLLDKSISMGKKVDISRYNYAAFVDSGASTSVSEFMNSALDVAKNAIMSSQDQAISWNAAGIRLRRWSNDTHTEYDPEQIWMNNNSILMTGDNWNTANIAIGKFHDENVGDCWGIVAPRIVGTLLAGSNLIIESAKRDGGVAVFRVDGEGCYLYNSDFNIVGNNAHIALNPHIGIALGDYPVYNIIDNEYIVDEDNAKFWVDTSGNLHFKGTLHATDGEFTGAVTATSLNIIAGEDAWSIDEYISDNDTVQGAYVAAGEKRRVFVSTPTPPYDVGDLWSQGTTGDLMRCDVAKGADGVYAASDWSKASKYTDDAALGSFIDGTYTDDKASLQNQIDGKIETWFSTDDPSANWNTDALKASHVGDMWYDSNSKKLKRWTLSGTTYNWGDIDDQDAIDAYTAASDAQDTADGKRRVFVSTPTPPYDVGDLWSQGTTGDLMRCDVAKGADGVYAASDWSKASKYTDDAAADAIHDGTNGIYFTSGSALKSCKITTADGVVLTGSAGDFFRVTNSEMGFFDSSSTALLYFSNGNLTISGTVNASSGAIGGWTIGTTDLTGGDWAGYTGMGMRIGDAAWGFWAGSGKFRVQPDGFLYAENAQIAGTITANGGSIGGFTIGSAHSSMPHALFCGGRVGESPTSTGMSADNALWAFWAGNGAFRVTQSGNLVANNATITGNSTFSGSLNGATGTFSGSLNAARGTFSGSLSAASGSFSGTLNAANGIFAGQWSYSANGLSISFGMVDGYSDPSIYPSGYYTCNVGTRYHPFDYMFANHFKDPSSIKIKKNIVDLCDDDYSIMDFHPITYEMKNSDSGIRSIGFIAEEVDKVAPLLVEHDQNGIACALEYTRFSAISIREIQKLWNEIHQLRLKILELEGSKA